MIESAVIPHRPEPKPGETKPGPEVAVIPPKPIEIHPEARPVAKPETKNEP